MRLYAISLAIVSLCLLVVTAHGNAAISVSPQTATVGQTITVNLSRTLPKDIGTMSLRINFGDGSPTIFSPTYGPAPGNYSFRVTHSYPRPGTYTVTGQSFIIVPSVPSIPITERRSVTILTASSGGPGIQPGSQPPGSQPIIGSGATVPLEDPSRGTVGEAYDHYLSLNPAARSNRYQLVGSRLPPGLKLERTGLITGIPAREGKFVFTVKVIERTGASYLQTLTIFIDRGELTIRVTPDVIDTSRGGRTTQKVTFTVIAPTVLINETVRSSRGEFVAAGRILGYINRPMNINLNTHQPSASEKITVPSNVLRAAQSAGTSRIIYRRTFNSQNLERGSGETKINMITAASGQLRITRLRIFFEQNNRPIILVERNSRDITGVVEIHYNGAGTFKGYWKVDQRIIQRVQKNMYYGKVLTLKTPNAPPLPTYSEGAHRLQFIVTEPESAQQKIDFPEAIYHVEAKTAVFVAPITLTAPANGAQLDVSGGTFSWTEPPRVATYLVEFFEAGADEPFFTAYTKQGSYTLPAKVLSLKFETARSYSWHIRGFNSGSLLNAESSDRSFEILE